MEQPRPQWESPAGKPKTLSDKLSKVLSVSAKDQERRKAALASLTAIPDMGEPDLQGNLRGVVQRKEIETNKKFLEAFGNVVKHLEKLELDIRAMDDTCSSMKRKLDDARSHSTILLDHVEGYNRGCAVSLAQIRLADGFLETFTLSEDEVHALCSPKAPINSAFFTALDRLMQIQRDCRVLLSTQHHRAGTQISESMAQHQEAAYEKLFRWIQTEASTAFGRESLDVSELMSRALNALQDRPVSFQAVMDDLTSTRRKAISSAFLKAMTKGGPGGTPRPIDLQAHDPFRYINDMLAWVHQACASEKEMLESIFDAPANPSSSPDRTPPSDNLLNDPDTYKQSQRQTLDTMTGMLSSSMEGMCQPLKSRMHQALVQTQDPTESYRTANLVHYYAVTMSKLLSEHAVLARTIYETAETAYRHLYMILSEKTQDLLRSAETPRTGPEVMRTVRKQAQQLKDILASHETSLMVAPGSEKDLSQFDFGETLDAIVDPLLEMCNIACQHLGPIMGDIYFVNCMRQIESIIAPFPSTERKKALIRARIDDILTTLVSEQYKQLLTQSNLEKVVDTLNDKDPETPLSKDMSADTLKDLLSVLGPFLKTSEDVLPQLSELSEVKDHKRIRSEAFKRLIGTYERIHNAISNPRNEYDDPSSILPFTLEDMETINAIFIQDM